MNNEYYLDPRVAEAYDHDHAIRTEDSLLTDDVPFYVGLAEEAAAAGQTVLELACGTGRVTIPIAQAGVTVTGLDSSPAMLDVARRKAASLGAEVDWIEAEMTSFDLGRRFGLVTIPFRSFLLLLTVEEQKACLERIREHLLPGGRLALNIFNPRIPHIAESLRERRGMWQRTDMEKGRELWASREYRPNSQRLDETRADLLLDDAGAVISRVERNLRLRWVYRYEMQHLLGLCGFEVEAVYGWFDGRPFDEDSGEMVWLAKRPVNK